MSTGGPGQGGDRGGPLPKGSMTTPGICGCHKHLRVALGHKGLLRSSAKGIRDCSRDLWLSGASPGGPGPWGGSWRTTAQGCFLIPSATARVSHPCGKLGDPDKHGSQSSTNG